MREAEQSQEPGGCVSARGAKELRNLLFNAPGRQWQPLLDKGLRGTVHQGIDAPMGVALHVNMRVQKCFHIHPRASLTIPILPGPSGVGGESGIGKSEDAAAAALFGCLKPAGTTAATGMGLFVPDAWMYVTVLCVG